MRRAGEAARHRRRSLRPALAQGLRSGAAQLYVQQPHRRHLGHGRRSGQWCTRRRRRVPSGEHHRIGARQALDLPAKLLETTTGDLTIHCSDTLHRAYPPSAHRARSSTRASRCRRCPATKSRQTRVTAGSPQRVDRRAGADRRIGQPRRQQPVRAPQRLTASSPRVLDLGDRFRRGRNLVSPLLRRRP